MKKTFILCILLAITHSSYVRAQGLASDHKTSSSAHRSFFSSKKVNFNGQWKGGFADNSSGYIGFASEKTDYVLELECNGHLVTGYSYTYFYEGTKRFYTICKVTGTINELTKEITVTEYERTKFNTPPDFRNCFQVHQLKYERVNGDTEELVGKWHPAPDQQGDCGFGTTVLSRRVITKHSSLPPPEIKKEVVKEKKRNPEHVAIHTPSHIPDKIVHKKDSVLTRKDTADITQNSDPDRLRLHPPEPVPEYKKRTNEVLKSIDIVNDSVTVDFYDNGAVDGDSITVYFNGKQITQHLMVTEKAASFTLGIDKNRPFNELVMYAENLGIYPPNTALMVVMDGDKRYDVNMSSDFTKNATIYFHYKKK